MSFQAYLDAVKTKTGKTPEDFTVLAAERGLTRHGEIVAWLKQDFGLGHGHAGAIAGVVLRAGQPKRAASDKMAALFNGKKAHWREPVDRLFTALGAFGPDVAIEPGGTYVNLLRSGRKFGIVQPSSADRLDIGVKIKGRAAQGRFEEAGSWNAMVTHRIRVTEAAQIDADLLSWLKQAYEAA